MVEQGEDGQGTWSNRGSKVPKGVYGKGTEAELGRGS